MTKERLQNILTAYLEADLEAGEPEYVRELLTGRCGCSIEEIKELGVYSWLGFDKEAETE